MQSAYAAAGDLEQLGYTLDTTTLAMCMPLDETDMPTPELDLRPLEWSDSLRVFDLPSGLLANGNRNALQVTVAWIDGEPASSALTFDHAGDCGIYNVGTLVHAAVGFRNFGRFLEYVPRLENSAADQ